ncbi:glycosyl hydrolase family 76-domain-containing protein [Chaetomium strumarium]|uniref:Glycosyl hydrolase family 76-domain-containing protein n=1 Tax=Chaetomium strumarium TaxID=1170767 RepID=A0AAJ0LY58_9PEZI|nr:glycosyl hydrolase family 76-domain-containing protein [Chaetomium strumarium]
MRPSLFFKLGFLWSIPGFAVAAGAQQQVVEPLPETHPVRSDDRIVSEKSPSRTRDLDPRTAARAAIAAMNDRFFAPSQNIWSPGDPWWVSGVALTGIIDYMRKSNSSEYLDQVEKIIHAQRVVLSWWPRGLGEFRADSTDDTGWWALAMIGMYDLTGNSTYLGIAIEDEVYMYGYWSDNPCGGGLYVDIPKLTYKNAIANELYIKLAASLHNRIDGDTVYLPRAEKAWSWFQGSGMIGNGSNLINDGLTSRSDGTCFNNQLPVWTYNQGVILGALVELYQATKNDTYLSTAQFIADAVLAADTTLVRDGVLTEAGCSSSSSSSSSDESQCNSDQQAFKGIFAGNLAELDAALPQPDDDGREGSNHRRPYKPFLQLNAQSVYGRDRRVVESPDGELDLYDVSWAGPFRNSTVAKQASALWLLVAVMR